MTRAELETEATRLERQAAIIRDIVRYRTDLAEPFARMKEALRQIAVILGLPEDASGGAVVEAVRSMAKRAGSG